jgi:hypothetical protein
MSNTVSNLQIYFVSGADKNYFTFVNNHLTRKPAGNMDVELYINLVLGQRQDHSDSSLKNLTGTGKPSSQDGSPDQETRDTHW